MSLPVFMLEPRYTKSFTTSKLLPSISTYIPMLEYLAVDDKRYFVLLSFTARIIIRASSANYEKATSPSQMLLPMISAYARGMILLLKIVPVCLKPAAQIIFSIRILKKSQDRESPCLKSRLASKDSDRLLPTFTTQGIFKCHFTKPY